MKHSTFGRFFFLRIVGLIFFPAQQLPARIETDLGPSVSCNVSYSVTTVESSCVHPEQSDSPAKVGRRDPGVILMYTGARTLAADQMHKLLTGIRVT